ncbi:hypothetical protein [Candidatus Phycosocius spiralis]|nr:hypothetical protein [Candidatus Phycosocius spiralis]
MRFAAFTFLLITLLGWPIASFAQSQETPKIPEITVNLGRAITDPGVSAPLNKLELDVPQSIVPHAAQPVAPAPVLELTQPGQPLTKAQIAKEIAPNFDVAKDYVRLVKCYGTADFLGAITRIQASRPGAPPQVIGVAREIMALRDAMQPMVLAVSTVRGEPRFRADYDGVARAGQRDLAASKNPNATMQGRLALLESCRRDVMRWRARR